MIIAAAIERMGILVLALALIASIRFFTSVGTHMADPCPFTPVYFSNPSLKEFQPLTF